MHKFDFLDKKKHGTVDFPMEYYYVDSNHPRYHMVYHWHNEWELLRVVKGSFLLTLDDEKYLIKEGDIVLISCETLHGGEAIDCVYECLVFDFFSLFNKIDIVKSQLRPFYKKEICPDRFYNNSDIVVSKLIDIFSDNAVDSCSSLDVLSAFASFFAWIIKEKRYQNVANKGNYSSRIKSVLEYIEEHYDEELSLELLASIAGMNARYFCKFFYSHTQYTPINYVNFYRIEQASFLLNFTDLPITQIAINCGFWESSYFTKVFKKFKGISPYKYRQCFKRSEIK